jgi:hypothetical protein
VFGNAKPIDIDSRVTGRASCLKNGTELRRCAKFPGYGAMVHYPDMLPMKRGLRETEFRPAIEIDPLVAVEVILVPIQQLEIERWSSL